MQQTTSSESPKTEKETKKTPPFHKDKEIEIKEKEIGVVRQVISDSDLKTQVTQSERIIIPLLEQLANRPFSISEKIAKSRGILFNSESYKVPILSDFIKEYLRKGKALDRRGIKEDTDIVSAYFTAQIEAARAANRVKEWQK